MNAFQLLFGLSGRIDRDNFWRAFAVIAMVWMLLLVATPMVVPGANSLYRAEFAILSCWFMMLARRRLHDRNRSSCWLLVMYGVPAAVFLGFVTLLEQQSTFMQDYPYALIIGFAFLAPIGLWTFVELFYLHGTSGANHYGPDPLDPAV